MLQDLVRRTLCWKSFGFLSSDKQRENMSWSKSPSVQALQSCRFFSVFFFLFLFSPMISVEDDKVSERDKRKRIQCTSVFEISCETMIEKLKVKMINMNILEKWQLVFNKHLASPTPKTDQGL